MNVSKNQLKRIRGLTQKKNRQEEQAFLVEGEHNLLELLRSNWPIELLVVSQAFAQQHAQALADVECVHWASVDQLAQSGQLKSNNAGVAVVSMPRPLPPPAPSNDWVLALDDIQDPGNVGTLLRIADWYGVHQIVLSPNSVEVFNPKVISASKGAFLRVEVREANLSEYLAQVRAQKLPVYGAYLSGDTVHQLMTPVPKGVLLLGNESQGISAALAPYVSRPLTIGAYGQAESLNVAVAGGILLDNLKRLSP
jgi:TrmH family RNA methyltransferase